MRKILPITLVLWGCSNFEQQGFRTGIDGKADVTATAAILHTPLKGGCPAKMVSTSVAKVDAKCVEEPPSAGGFSLEVSGQLFTVEETSVETDENGNTTGVVVAGGPVKGSKTDSTGTP